MPPRNKKSSKRTIAVYSIAEAYLALLHDRGIEYFFGNGGTDFTPLVEAFAKSASHGSASPFTYTSPSRHQVESARYPAPECIEEAAEALSNAEFPLIVTQRVGARPTAVKSLVELAESLAIPVVYPAGIYMNFPSNHPLHLGHAAEPLGQEADAILVIEADVPWFPSMAKPKDTATVLRMGIDPFFSPYPVRGYPCDIPIVADASVAIPLLTQELGRSRAKAARAIGDRLKRINAQHEAQQCGAHERPAHLQHERPIEFESVSHCIDQVKDDDTILVNAYDLNLT